LVWIGRIILLSNALDNRVYLSRYVNARQASELKSRSSKLVDLKDETGRIGLVSSLENQQYMLSLAAMFLRP